MTIEAIKLKITPIFKQQGVTRASIFGSVARGEYTAASDIDMLVELKRPYGLIRFVGLKRKLEEALQKPVDVVEYEAIKPDLKKNILKDATLIYEQE